MHSLPITFSLCRSGGAWRCIVHGDIEGPSSTAMVLAQLATAPRMVLDWVLQRHFHGSADDIDDPSVSGFLPYQAPLPVLSRNWSDCKIRCCWEVLRNCSGVASTIRPAGGPPPVLLIRIWMGFEAAVLYGPHCSPLLQVY